MSDARFEVDEIIKLVEQALRRREKEKWVELPVSKRTLSYEAYREVVPEMANDDREPICKIHPYLLGAAAQQCPQCELTALRNKVAKQRKSERAVWGVKCNGGLLPSTIRTTEQGAHVALEELVYPAAPDAVLEVVEVVLREASLGPEL
jgi:hypothetical protein